MRLPSPTSFGHLSFRLSSFDVVWAAAAPPIALYLRDSYVLTAEGATLGLLYCGLSFVCSLLAFLAFRLNNGMSRFFSVHDALNVVKAVVAAQLMTGLVLFSITRLEGIPRSTPLVQLLVLAAGLFAARIMMKLSSSDPKVTAAPSHLDIEHAILIGSTDLSVLYIKFLRTYAAGRRRIVAVLDANPNLIGRAIVRRPHYRRAAEP